MKPNSQPITPQEVAAWFDDDLPPGAWRPDANACSDLADYLEAVRQQVTTGQSPGGQIPFWKAPSDINEDRTERMRLAELRKNGLAFIRGLREQALVADGWENEYSEWRKNESDHNLPQHSSDWYDARDARRLISTIEAQKHIWDIKTPKATLQHHEVADRAKDKIQKMWPPHEKPPAFHKLSPFTNILHTAVTRALPGLSAKLKPDTILKALERNRAKAQRKPRRQR